ncbi:hypothetical protein D3C76_1365930 [compost metagenome]
MPTGSWAQPFVGCMASRLGSEARHLEGSQHLFQLPLTQQGGAALAGMAGQQVAVTLVIERQRTAPHLY